MTEYRIQNTEDRRKTRDARRCGMTLMEIVVSLAIITIIIVVIVPQFVTMRNTWDSKQGAAEALQNGRVLIDHLNRNLSKAVRITAVSDSNEANGFIQFEDNDGNDLRYDINSTSSYVEFGYLGELSDLAGPVSQLQFSCYDACDLDTALDISTADVNDIRFVKAETTLTNSSTLGQDETLTASAYLRTNDDESSECWQNVDIGDVGAAGSAIQSDSNWTIEGSGAGLGPAYSTDEFHFVYQTLSGDGQIIARVVSVEDTSSLAKIGLMIRETLDDDSKYAGMFITPTDGVYFQERTSTGGGSSYTAGSGSQAPHWFKVTRTGDTLAGYESSDGSTWTQVDTVSITMATDVYVGMVVCSNNDGVLCTAEFDNVSFSTLEYQEFTEAKADSDTTSITISTPGSSMVAILGSWTPDLTHTAEAGSNRALIFIAHEESLSGDPSLTSVTYGGQAMTKVIERSAVATYGNYVAGFILDEAGVAAATSDTFVPTWSAATSSVSYASVFLSGVNQTTLTGESASNGTTGVTPNPITTSALSTNDGDMVILGATNGNNGSYTLNNGFTEGTDQSVGANGHTGVTGYKSATGADETPSATFDATVNRQVIIGFVVQGVGSSDIEGDLLVAAVATDGSETISPPGGEGWTEIDIDNYIGEVTLGAWWKLADASESSSHEFTWSGDEQAYGWMMRFTGHDPNYPINDWSASGESSSTPTSPAVTTTVDNCLILRLGAFDGDDITVDDPGLSGHTAITMDKSGSGGGGGSAVSILGSWLSGTTHTAESGSDRALIFIAHAEHSSGTVTLNSVTYGGQSMTKIIDESIGTGYSANVAAFILDEAGIDAAFGNTFVPTWSVTPGAAAYTSVFIQNVDQTTSIGDLDSASTTSSNPIVTDALATAEGDMVFVAATCGNLGSYTLNNGFTEGTDQQFGDATTGGTGVAGYKAATGVAETPSATYNASINRQVIIGFVAQVVTEGSDTVSGGAGYVSQSSSGDSGTSTFSLNSSNEAQMLTIAIAPDSNDDSGCVNQIRP